MFFFECIEILRRTVWAVFRIEWEVVVKLFHAGHGGGARGADDDDDGAEETQPLASVVRED